MRRFWIPPAMLGTLTALCGCALPPVAVVASYSADIVSYAATGKTVTDHAYSAVARSDCSFIRILKRKPICVDAPPADATSPPQVAALAEPAPKAPSAEEPRYVTIGSFLEERHAQRARERYSAFHAEIVPATVHGKHFHRVIAGPLSAPEAKRLEESLVAATPAPKASRG